MKQNKNKFKKEKVWQALFGAVKKTVYHLQNQENS
jgi:hypothetical protein